MRTVSAGSSVAGERAQVRAKLVRGTKGAYDVVLPEEWDAEYPRELATQPGDKRAAVPGHDLLNVVARRRD